MRDQHVNPPAVWQGGGETVRLTILIDNTGIPDRFFRTEQGLSIHLEVDGKRVLFDTGYSGAFLENAEMLSVSLDDLDYIVLSHGHYDHTWGLVYLVKYYTERRAAGWVPAVPHLVAHPLCLYSRFRGPHPEVGSLLSAERLSHHFPLCLSARPVWLTENLVFLGEIERIHQFESYEPGDRMIRLPDGSEEPDQLLDDTALACRTPAGILVITGCSHSGICNIVDYACKICGDSRVAGIIGGLHLLQSQSDRIRATASFIAQVSPGVVCATHCTSLAAKMRLSEVVPMREGGAGLQLIF